MATVLQNNKFKECIVVNYPLDEAIDWINKNMDPEEVFDETPLNEWAGRNGFVKEDQWPNGDGRMGRPIGEG